MSETQFTITVLMALLLVASGVAMATRWVRVPYTLLLVIVGLTISPMHFLPTVHISPDLILLIFLPALLFEAAWNLKLDQLRRNLLPILVLAVPGVALSAGVVAVLLHFGIGLPWLSALLFGSMISATDPVSVLALFRKLKLPHRLTTIVEGESLFNDGIAVVVFRIVLGIIVGAAAGDPGSLLVGSLREFAVVVFGGLAVGVVVGLVASTLTSYFDDHLLEITLTTIAAYGCFLVAEGLHVSGVIAVLIAGLIIGNYGRPRGMSATTQVAVNSFWEYAAFVVNSLVFLLIGLEIQIAMLADHLLAIVWAALAVLAARAVSVYLLMPLTGRLRGEGFPRPWLHLMTWGGLRGSLSIALVLSLPVGLAGRAELVVLVFGAVLFSLLAQGLSISPLLNRLGLAREEPLEEYELVQGRLLLGTAALAELNGLRGRGLISERAYRAMHPALEDSQTEMSLELSGLSAPPADREVSQLHRRLVDAKKARLSALLREHVISEAACRVLSRELDEESAPRR